MHTNKIRPCVARQTSFGLFNLCTIPFIIKQRNCSAFAYQEKINNKGNKIRKFPNKKGFWCEKENVEKFLSNLKEIYNFETPKDWNLLSIKQIKSNGGSGILKYYSIYDLKCIGSPEGINYFDSPPKPSGYWDNKENVIKFLKKISIKYNLNTLEEWDSLSVKHIESNTRGNYLLQKYSIYELKCIGFPEGKSFFKSTQRLSNDLNNEENIKIFIKQLGEKLNLKTKEDWNSLTNKQIIDNGGYKILKDYSLCDLKSFGFPDNSNYFVNLSKPLSYWDKHENVLQFLNEIKEKHTYKSITDCKSLNSKIIKLNGGEKLLKKYTLLELKSFMFPNSDIQDFSNKPSGYWLHIENVKEFLDELKEKYNFKTSDDWNSLSVKQIKLNGGTPLLQSYSLFDLKCIGFPEGKDHFNPPQKSSGYWDNEENVIQFLKELKLKLNFKTPDDWNKLTKKHIQLYGGSSRIFKNYSILQLKCLACPEGKENFKSSNKPSGYWNNKENINKFIDHLKVKLNLKTPEDWQRLSKRQIQFFGGEGLISKIPIHSIIQNYSKLNNHDENNFPSSKHKRSSQRWLFLQVQKLFPDDEIVEDYFHPEISRESGFSVQFDVFLIHKNIALEYHGKQHYEDIPYGFAPIEMYINRDNEKIKLCKKYGIHLVIIPYWWDNSLDSLKDIIEKSK